MCVVLINIVRYEYFENLKYPNHVKYKQRRTKHRIEPIRTQQVFLAKIICMYHIENLI